VEFAAIVSFLVHGDWGSRDVSVAGVCLCQGVREFCNVTCNLSFSKLVGDCLYWLYIILSGGV
jgi:hypothetical protein